MRWVRLVLQGFGALSLLVLIAGIGFIYWPHRTRDVRFVFGWGGLDPAQSYHVTYARNDSNPFNGDFYEVYCIDITSFAPSHGEQWVAAPVTNPLMQEALDLAVSFAGQPPCVPSSDDISHGGYLVNFWSVGIHGQHADSASVIIHKAGTNHLVYVGFAT